MSIGAQKAGSTAIAEWLFNNGIRHPQVFEGEPKHYSKEVQLFDLSREWNYTLNAMNIVAGTLSSMSFVCRWVMLERNNETT